MVNHGIDSKLIEKSFETLHEFFEKPQEFKDKFLKNKDVDLFDGYCAIYSETIYGDKPDYHEGMMWNASHARHAIKEQEYWKDTSFPELQLKSKELSLDVLKAYALVLGLEENFFADKHEWVDGISTSDHFRINYYPKKPEGASGRRMSPHSDYISVTLLLQNRLGLEVWDKTNKRWTLVQPDLNTFVVNTGNMMEFWTNGQFVSSMHQVPHRAYSDERVSIVFFSGPQDSVIIDSRDVKPNEEPKHVPIEGGQLLRNIWENLYEANNFKENTINLEALVAAGEACMLKGLTTLTRCGDVNCSWHCRAPRIVVLMFCGVHE
eukprot:TRINITY_DN3448_c0_g1_i2.p1 TRINITY_DN3448_c0_g1~~TRINITY_DN3448_c0_g1_i2.p1  ORF type:complete len:321 (+),score=48.05 TRINITY_DN3448_c0_g1_i2:195-1157(+)